MEMFMSPCVIPFLSQNSVSLDGSTIVLRFPEIDDIFLFIFTSRYMIPKQPTVQLVPVLKRLGRQAIYFHKTPK